MANHICEKDLYIKYSKNLRVKKENTLIRKLAKDMEDILSKTIYRWQVTYGKMFNITSYYTSVRTDKIKNSGNVKCWQGCGETGSLLHCWWEGKMGQPPWK